MHVTSEYHKKMNKKLINNKIILCVSNSIKVSKHPRLSYKKSISDLSVKHFCHSFWLHIPCISVVAVTFFAANDHCTLHCTGNTVQCTPYTVHCMLYNVHSTHSAVEWVMTTPTLPHDSCKCLSIIGIVTSAVSAVENVKARLATVFAA